MSTRNKHKKDNHMTRSTAVALTFALSSSLVFAACQSKPGVQSQPNAQTSTQSTQTATSTTAKTISASTTYQSPGETEQIAFHIRVLHSQLLPLIALLHS